MPRWLVRVEGVVQGVGFRPFVHATANELDLSGFVGNDAHGVFIEAEGPAAGLAGLVSRIQGHPPPLAKVDSIVTAELPERGERGFRIVESVAGSGRSVLISPDVATCADCLDELFDPDDRRYRYPFINCTNCGPRYTIVNDVPYDRAATTMAGFPMCAACAAEYHDPTDRRFHAQPVCCPGCGPRVQLVDRAGALLGGDPISGAAAALLAGQVVAVKGLGGFHLAADAGNEDAVAALRARKHREDKPFAVMCAGLGEAARLADADAGAVELLTGPSRPIVLLPRHAAAPVAASVAPGNRSLGVLLPYSPLHHLLLRAVGRPIVMTSGNRSDEPIAYRDADARERLAGIADLFLVHDRAIHIRTDDSVLRLWRGRPLPVRRSRGQVPAPLPLPLPLTRPALACGAELKNTVAIGRGRQAFVSHHIGDLENAETMASFREAITHLGRLFGIEPTTVAHDLHPEYLSTKYAVDLPEVELVGVQHHHAHVASCLADNGTAGPAIGVAFDGLGYGPDGTLWGGELLLADLAGFTRLGHLSPAPLPGGAAAIREPWRMAVAWLLAAGSPDGDPVSRFGDRAAAVTRLAASGLAPATTSVGRLFDAVAALCGVRDRINYEGQAAIELEQLADPAEQGGYPATVLPGPPLVLAGEDLVAAVVDDLAAGTPVPTVAARFHHGLATATSRAVVQLREVTGVSTVALSGGVFQNLLLLQSLAGRLEAAGFVVLTHSNVPPNDGGISLGQLAVVAGRQGAGGGIPARAQALTSS
jgi:hydrogenase maturation protein HypF